MEVLVSDFMKNPDVIPNDKGVYFLISNNEEILYVGRSLNLKTRLKVHFRIYQNMIPNGIDIEIYKNPMLIRKIRIEIGKEFYDFELKIIRILNPKFNFRSVMPWEFTGFFQNIDPSNFENLEKDYLKYMDERFIEYSDKIK